MEKETYKEIEKIADNLQAAAGREAWNQERGCYSDHTNQLCFW